MTDDNTIKILDAIADVRVKVEQTNTQIARTDGKIEKLRGEMNEGFARRPTSDDITQRIDAAIAHQLPPKPAPVNRLLTKVILTLAGVITALSAIIAAV
jgi:hypothetical protein